MTYHIRPARRCEAVPGAFEICKSYDADCFLVYFEDEDEAFTMIAYFISRHDANLFLQMKMEGK